MCIESTWQKIVSTSTQNRMQPQLIFSDSRHIYILDSVRQELPQEVVTNLKNFVYYEAKLRYKFKVLMDRFEAYYPLVIALSSMISHHSQLSPRFLNNQMELIVHYTQSILHRYLQSSLPISASCWGEICNLLT